MLKVNSCNGVLDVLQMDTPTVIHCPVIQLISPCGGTATPSEKTSVEFEIHEKATKLNNFRPSPKAQVK